VAEVIGKAERDGKRCYYVNDGIYHTFSGVLFDHCQYRIKAFKKGPTQLCAVFGRPATPWTPSASPSRSRS